MYKALCLLSCVPKHVAIPALLNKVMCQELTIARTLSSFMVPSSLFLSLSPPPPLCMWCVCMCVCVWVYHLI